jgi:hypothetical protein
VILLETHLGSHNTVHTRQFQALVGILSVEDISVGEYRNLDSLFDRLDLLPVRQSLQTRRSEINSSRTRPKFAIAHSNLTLHFPRSTVARKNTRSRTFHHLRIGYSLLDLGEYTKLGCHGDGEVGVQGIDWKKVS